MQQSVVMSVYDYKIYHCHGWGPLRIYCGCKC